MKDIYKPRGREAHVPHLDKVGQSWQQVTKLACICDRASRFYQRVIKIDSDKHVTCPECGEVVIYDTLGYAFCQCKIWNDSAAPPRRKLDMHSIMRSVA